MDNDMIKSIDVMYRGAYIDENDITYIPKKQYLPIFQYSSKEVKKGFGLEFIENYYDEKTGTLKSAKVYFDICDDRIQIEICKDENDSGQNIFNKPKTQKNYEEAIGIIKSIWCDEKSSFIHSFIKTKKIKADLRKVMGETYNEQLIQSLTKSTSHQFNISEQIALQILLEYKRGGL